jgi:integrase
MATILKYKVANGFRWRVRWWDENEKQVSKTFDRQAIARDFMVKLENEMREGIYTEPSKIRLSDYLSEWIEAYQDNLAPNTARSYRINIKHITGILGNRMIQKLQPAEIENAYAELGKILSPKSVIYIHTTLSRALSMAEKQRLITRNPCFYVDRPKKDPQSKASFVHPDDIALYLNTFKDSYLYVPVCLALFGGLRRGEALGLQWKDVDFKKGLITVKNNLTYDGLRIPKNGKFRTIPISAPIQKVLIEQRDMQRKSKELLWDKYHRSDYVCTKEDGTILDPSTVSSRFGQILKREGIPHVRYHDLRHTAASLMILEGVDLKTISEILGHSSISITADVYGHVLEEQKRKAVGTLDKYFQI